MQDIDTSFQTIRFIEDMDDKSTSDPLLNHAIDEAIAISVAKGLQPATIRCWRYDKAVMLGRRDMRLPHMDDAIEWLRGHEYDVAVRPCGGTGVPLTKDVLNVSWIFPTADYIQFPLDGAFQKLADILIQALAPIANVTIGEIKGSYCPGDFDLSINGFKIAGIAQRRIAGAIAVQAYLLVNGKGRDLFSVMETMYQIAGYHTVPVHIRPLPSLSHETNRSMEEAVGHPIPLHSIVANLFETMQQHGTRVLRESLSAAEKVLTEQERKRFEEVLKLQAFQKVPSIT